MNSSRKLTLGLSALAGALVIALLSLVLPQASPDLAVTLLDYRPDGPLPYPLTVQNLMLLLFAVGLGDVVHAAMRTRYEGSGRSVGLLPEERRLVVTNEMLTGIQSQVIALRKRSDERFLVRLVEQCVISFQASDSAEDAHQMLRSLSDLEMHRVDLRYTLLRYLAWVIPTVGFIGTVLGIAQALSALDASGSDASADLMQLAIGPLSMAFNTTLIALGLSAVLVMLIQFTQSREEETINESVAYCLGSLIQKLQRLERP